MLTAPFHQMAFWRAPSSLREFQLFGPKFFLRIFTYKLTWRQKRQLRQPQTPVQSARNAAFLAKRSQRAPRWGTSLKPSQTVPKIPRQWLDKK